MLACCSTGGGGGGGLRDCDCSSCSISTYSRVEQREVYYSLYMMRVLNECLSFSTQSTASEYFALD
jgi:hypothetical protein